MGVSCRKIEKEETPQQALIRKLREELEVEISVGELIDTIEYTYPTFHLFMDCLWSEIVTGKLMLNEADDAKWLSAKEPSIVQWLPADILMIDKIREVLVDDYIHI